jgi:hypothetical protein
MNLVIERWFSQLTDRRGEHGSDETRPANPEDLGAALGRLGITRGRLW